MKLAVCALLLLLAGCEPVLGIEIAGTGGKVTFSFVNCRDGTKLGVNHVSVIDKLAQNPEESAREVCELRPPVGPVSKLTEWEYGAPVTGFALMSCQELRIGETYTVVVSRPYGARRFRLLEDYSVSALDPVCGR
jgi:hypothetical protein